MYTKFWRPGWTWGAAPQEALAEAVPEACVAVDLVLGGDMIAAQEVKVGIVWEVWVACEGLAVCAVRGFEAG